MSGHRPPRSSGSTPVPDVDSTELAVAVPILLVRRRRLPEGPTSSGAATPPETADRPPALPRRAETAVVLVAAAASDCSRCCAGGSAGSVRPARPRRFPSPTMAGRCRPCRDGVVAAHRSRCSSPSSQPRRRLGGSCWRAVLSTSYDRR